MQRIRSILCCLTVALFLASSAWPQTISIPPSGGGSVSPADLSPGGSSDISATYATRTYVDAVAQGLEPKERVRAKSIAALPANTYANGTAGVGATLTGNANGALPAVDGITLLANERVLINDEAAGPDLKHGIYIVSQVGSAGTPFILTRAVDMDTAAEIAGAYFFIAESGSTLANSGWIQTPAGALTVGTTALKFLHFNDAGNVTASEGLEKIGNDVRIAAGGVTSAKLSANAVTAPAIATGAVGNDELATDAVTSAKIASETITHADIAVANKDGAAATPSLRTLGTGASQAAAGNDARLSDQRTPLDNSVSTAKLQSGAVTGATIATATIAEVKLSFDVATQAELDAVAAGSLSGPAGGDLSGTYPNPDVVNDSHVHTDTTVSGLVGRGLFAALPASPAHGDLFRVEDAAGLTDCSTGGGVLSVLCGYDGTTAAWYAYMRADANVVMFDAETSTLTPSLTGEISTTHTIQDAWNDGAVGSKGRRGLATAIDPDVIEGETLERRCLEAGGNAYCAWFVKSTGEPVTPAFDCPTGNTCIFSGDGVSIFSLDADTAIMTYHSAPLFTDGIKLTLNPNATNAGLNVGGQAGDPSSLTNGDVWYNSTTNKLRCRENGATVDCIGAGGGSSIIFDIGDDAGNDSTALGEIATTGDTTGVFTESAADKMLVNLTKPWPGGVSSKYFDAIQMNPDGANCLPVVVTLNSGPMTDAIACADSNSSIIYGKTAMGEIGGCPASTLNMSIHLYHGTTEAITFAGDFSAMYRRWGSADVVNGTWGSAVAADVSIATAHEIETATASVTPNGTCALTGFLFWRYVVDAVTFSTNAANSRVLGMTIAHP